MSQSPNPIAHMPMPHIPILHATVALAAAAHLFPHTPQLFTSVSIFVSHPSIAFMLQSLNPLKHPPRLHCALVHTAVPFCTTGHILLHPPQFIGSCETCTSQPSPAMPLQSA